MTGVFIGVALTLAAITTGAWCIRSAVRRYYTRDGIARLEAMVNHPAGHGL